MTQASASLFRLHAATTADLIHEHRTLHGRGKPKDMPEADRQRLADIDAMLDERLAVAPIDAGDTRVVEQLVGYDAVHKYGAQSREDLLRLRVGREDDNKIAVALADPTDSSGTRVLAVIYVYKHNQPILTHRDIPGDVSGILAAPCEALRGQLTGMVFYSISNILLPDGQTPVLKGAGERLIAGLFPLVDRMGIPNDVVLSTLSPLRTLRRAYPDADFESMDDETLRIAAYAHLRSGTNPVQRFHLGNGARMADINLRANTPDSPDAREGAGVMLNYLYFRNEESRTRNKALFRRGELDALFEPELASLGSRLADQALRLKIAP